MKKLLVAAALALLSVCSSAQELSNAASLPDDLKTLMEDARPDQKVYREEVKENLEKKGRVIGIRELPMKKLFFVEAENGSYVISADGRFVMDGMLKDVWHRKTIRTLQDAEKVQRTPVSNIGFKPEEQLAHFVIGNPDLPRSGVAFVDPMSAYTVKFLQHIQENESEYNWTVVLMPMVGGSNSMDRARKLWCAVDKEQAKNDLINGTSESYSDLEGGCSEQPIQMAKYMASLFQIEQLPHIIREDGLSIGGFPVEFDKWYAQP
ncbi:hypothetical protein [Alteromonas gilva]|uniref:DsbC family protein n=1 Tax=Alteromonas gilva TaxID=2987522 RepID=A0ABT5L7G6_9ALTE|nr:hypothetical protein [Alteromonas gilva]MDC8832979.1 hypothetical protein [Alteromonas gilva]